MNEFDFNQYKKHVAESNTSAAELAQRAVRRLAQRGWSVEKICGVCCRDEAWVREQLQEGK